MFKVTCSKHLIAGWVMSCMKKFVHNTAKSNKKKNSQGRFLLKLTRL